MLLRQLTHSLAVVIHTFNICYDPAIIKDLKYLGCHFSIETNHFSRVCLFHFYDICNEQNSVLGCAYGKRYSMFGFVHKSSIFGR